MENDYTNQPYQATYMKNELNITVRGEDKEKVIADLMEMRTKYEGNVSNIEEPSVKKSNVSEDGGKCPECKSRLTKRYSAKNDGHFYGCSSYPECKFSKPIK